MTKFKCELGSCGKVICEDTKCCKYCDFCNTVLCNSCDLSHNRIKCAKVKCAEVIILSVVVIFWVFFKCESFIVGLVGVVAFGQRGER